MRALLAICLAALVALPALEASGSTTTNGVPAGWRRCVNRDLGYSVGYPGRWHALAACTYFDPKLSRVPANTDFYGFALQVTMLQNDYRTIVRSVTDRHYWRVLSLRRVLVAGRPATLVEADANGAGLYTKGDRFYTYVVDLGKRPPLMIQTVRLRGRAWGVRKQVADTAARTVRLLPPRNPA
jgi:hypothetical protein